MGDTWFILSAHWWVQWKGYTNYSEHNEKVKPNRRPGPIDNTPILDPKAANQLQDELLEGDDYIAMNQKAWQFIHKVYGGGPVLQRFIVEENQVLAVELHPVVLQCFKANSAGLPDAKTKKKLVVSKGFETKKVIHRLLKGMKVKAECTVISIRCLDDNATDTGYHIVPKTHRLFFGDIAPGEKYEALIEVMMGWRKDLVLNSIIDVQDDSKKWFEGKVVAERDNNEEGTSGPQVQIHIYGQVSRLQVQ
jgi:hypothetical protein